MELRRRAPIIALGIALLVCIVVANVLAFATFDNRCRQANCIVCNMNYASVDYKNSLGPDNDRPADGFLDALDQLMIAAIDAALGAALIVWFVMRIVNRRERWAIYTAVFGLLAYPGGYGPGMWLSYRDGSAFWANPVIGSIYWPVHWLYRNVEGGSVLYRLV